MRICAGKKCQLFTYVLQLSLLLYTPFPFPSPYQHTMRTFICRHLSRFCHLRWVAINASPLPLLRCQLIKIDAKYAKSRENPRGKFSKFSQLISQVTHAQQITGGGRGKCDWLLLFAYALPISPPLPRAYNVHGIIATPPGLPEAACSFNELGLFAFAYHRRMSRGIADGVPVPVVLVSPPPPSGLSAASPACPGWLATTIIQANCVLGGKCL